FAAQPGDCRHQPVVERRFLKIGTVIIKSRKEPVASKQRLGIHAGASLVTVPQVAVGKTVQKEKIEPARQEHEESGPHKEIPGPVLPLAAWQGGPTVLSARRLVSSRAQLLSVGLVQALIDRATRE